MSGGRLVFTIKPAQISYKGEWSEAEQHWSGAFTQGASMPMTLRRGLPPARPILEGLDGLWQGTVNRNGVDLRLVLRVTTKNQRGTIATFDSPDLGAVGLPVAAFSRGRRPSASLCRRRALASPELWLTTARASRELDPARSAGRRGRVRSNSASAEREARPRPQMPKPPFPYRAEEVTFRNPRRTG